MDRFQQWTLAYFVLIPVSYGVSTTIMEAVPAQQASPVLAVVALGGSFISLIGHLYYTWYMYGDTKAQEASVLWAVANLIIGPIVAVLYAFLVHSSEEASTEQE